MACKSIIKLCTVTKPVTSLSVRHISQRRSNKGFLGGFFDNLKEEMSKNKEMKDSIKKFRDEAKKLEQSDALKAARDKYKTIEEETDKSTKIIKEKLGQFGEQLKESDITKKAVETTGRVMKKAADAATNISKQTQEFSNTAAMKKVSENVKAIQSGINEATQLSKVKGYHPPATLRKRSEIAPENVKVYESNPDAQDIVLHKDSKFYQSWQNFKENNQYVNKLFDLKTKYDESDNTIVRASRAVTEKIYDLFGSLIQKNEMSAVLTEIIKMDPSFTIEEFSKLVHDEIIPNVLESLSRQELDILKDWCTESAFNILSHPINVAKQQRLKYHHKVYDISALDVVSGKMMDQGPVLIVTFNAQQIVYITDASGKIIEGEDKLHRYTYIWALCRDQTVLDPKAAWRVMESGAHASKVFI